MIRMITKDSFDRERKPTQAKYLRLHPLGEVYLSAGLLRRMNLKEGDSIICFFGEKEAFVSKLNTPETRTVKGWKLRKYSKNTLQFKDRYLVRKVHEFFGGLEEGAKSMRIDVLPEPIQRKEQHGYLLYRLEKRKE